MPIVFQITYCVNSFVTEALGRLTLVPSSHRLRALEPKKLENQSGPPHPTAMRLFCASGFFTPAGKVPFLCREWANTRPERGICPARLWWVS